MRIIVAVFAGALLGVSALAGKPDAQPDVSLQSSPEVAEMIGAPGVEAILPIVDALRSGDAVYPGMNRVSRSDYVSPRPPL
jgi:hypothetical protein